MKILKINPENLRESKEAIEEAVQVIRRGGVVVFPTDTVYGLGADATNESAVRKIFRIKQRPKDKPVPILISDLEMAKMVAYFDKKKEEMLLSIWPGPVTVLLQKKYPLTHLAGSGQAGSRQRPASPQLQRGERGSPKWAAGQVLSELITAGQSTIGLRIPDYKITHYMVALCGVPLVATSANISGQPPSNKLKEVIAQFEQADYRPELILDAGTLKFSEPSTILDLSKDKPMITRVGTVNKEKLFDIIGV